MNQEQYNNNLEFCPAPWNAVYISSSGDVDSCCISSNLLGNINQTPLETIINGEKNTKNLERLYDNAQNAYQKIVDTIQPAIDARNDAIGNVSNYINDIRGSLGDITTGADVKAVQTLLSQIQTTVNGTKISDLINPVNAMISQIDPMKMSNIPTLNAGFKNLSPDVFSNIDRNTGLPILNQGALDKEIGRAHV